MWIRKEKRETVSNLLTRVRRLDKIDLVVDEIVKKWTKKKKKEKFYDEKKGRRKTQRKKFISFENATSLSVTNPVHVWIEADFVETFLRGFLWIRLVCHRSRC